MRLLIDADGCPVVDLALRLAREAGVECIIFCDTAHVFERTGARTVMVSQGADSVDFAIVNAVKAGDIVVTQDYGLAAMSLARRAIPISQNGLVFTADNIDALLLSRHAARKVRQAGGRIRGPKKRTPDQDRAFEATLRRLLTAGTTQPSPVV